MNLMFIMPAAVASCIVACRAFTSLTNCRHQDVYIHTTRSHPVPSTRPHPVEGPARDDDGGGNNSNLVKRMGRMENIVAGIAFRSMASGIDSMGETSCPSGPGATG